MDLRTFLPSLTFGNTGNIVLSLCLLAFGPAGLALGIGYFTVNNMLFFIFGPAIESEKLSPSTLLRIPFV